MNSTPTADLAFSQNNLQDFLDCRRRFQLRYLMKLAWPAIESDPVLEHERLVQQGTLFHKMIQQYYLGIPVEAISAYIRGPDVSRWWANFLDNFQMEYQMAASGEAPRVFPEALLTGYIGGFQFRAKYDLIAVHPNGQITIYDWKSARKKTSRALLAERIQTRLYPCLLTLAGAYLKGAAVIQPEDIRLIYWFAEYPDQPEEFLYDQAKFDQDMSYFTDLAAQITGLDVEEFGLTLHTERCGYCVYRSFCQRGLEAGDLTDFGDDLESQNDSLSSLDFDRIEELPY